MGFAFLQEILQLPEVERLPAHIFEKCQVLRVLQALEHLPILLDVENHGRGFSVPDNYFRTFSFHFYG